MSDKKKKTPGPFKRVLDALKKPVGTAVVTTALFTTTFGQVGQSYAQNAQTKRWGYSRSSLTRNVELPINSLPQDVETDCSGFIGIFIRRLNAQFKYQFKEDLFNKGVLNAAAWPTSVGLIIGVNQATGQPVLPIKKTLTAKDFRPGMLIGTNNGHYAFEIDEKTGKERRTGIDHIQMIVGTPGNLMVAEMTGSSDVIITPLSEKLAHWNKLSKYGKFYVADLNLGLTKNAAKILNQNNNKPIFTKEFIDSTNSYPEILDGNPVTVWQASWAEKTLYIQDAFMGGNAIAAKTNTVEINGKKVKFEIKDNCIIANGIKFEIRIDESLQGHSKIYGGGKNGYIIKVADLKEEWSRYSVIDLIAKTLKENAPVNSGITDTKDLHRALAKELGAGSSYNTHLHGLDTLKDEKGRLLKIDGLAPIPLNLTSPTSPEKWHIPMSPPLPEAQKRSMFGYPLSSNAANYVSFLTNHSSDKVPFAKSADGSYLTQQRLIFLPHAPQQQQQTPSVASVYRM